MAYFVVTGLKVLIFLHIVTHGKGRISPKEPDLSMVANILQNLLKTFTYSLRESGDFVIATDKPPQLEPTVEKIINRKVKELKPFLQDYDYFENEVQDNNYNSNNKNKEINIEDDNITLEGEEDTTIIEFYPDTGTPRPNIRINDNKGSEFKDNIKKYIILRDKIKSALVEEAVSFKTQMLVTHTLDDMVAMIMRGQCPENNTDNTLQNGLRSKNVARTTKDLAKNWTEQWHAIKNKYNKSSKDHFSQKANPVQKLFMFFEQIQEFLTNIVNDAEHISNNYKVVCKLVKKDSTMGEIHLNNINLENYRASEDTKKFNCPTFKICSDELRRFMGRFYNNLNDTTVSTFRNYAAMYLRDINSDGSGEKESVIVLINKLGNETEHKISKIFKKATENFQVDHDKDKDENIRRLRTYVNDAIETCLYTIQSNVNGKIVSLRSRIMDNVKKDLKANIKVDLDNLATELKDGICRDFSSCNNRIMKRSYDNLETDSKAKAHNLVDKNKVYVKLQMNLDKKLKEDLARGNVEFFDYAFVPIKNGARKQSIIVNQIINVTRTTPPAQNTHNEKTPKNEIFKISPKKEKYEQTLKKDKPDKISKSGSKSYGIGSNLMKDKSVNIEADEYGKNRKTEKSKKNLDIEVTRPAKPRRTTRVMGSTRFMSHGVSAEILQ